MSENGTENRINKKKIKISLSQLVKIETVLASFSENLQVKMDDDKKSYENTNIVLEILTKIREKHGLCAEDGYPALSGD